MKTFWFWLPRILGLFFGGFLALFALDVFDMQGEPLQLLSGFLVHTIPTWIILLATIIAWRWERLGGLLFITIAVVALFFFRGEWPVGVVICAILALIGALFLWDAHRQLRPAG